MTYKDGQWSSLMGCKSVVVLENIWIVSRNQSMAALSELGNVQLTESSLSSTFIEHQLHARHRTTEAQNSTVIEKEKLGENQRRDFQQRIETLHRLRPPKGLRLGIEAASSLSSSSFFPHSQLSVHFQ